MEDTLVSFETAKLAKDKGFDEFTNTYYTHVKIEPSVQIDCNKYYKNSLFEESDYRICSAPTQSLLQKWLREQGWHIVINYDEQGWFYGTFHLAKPNDTFNPPTEGKTYEEVLEEGLVFLLNQL